MFRIVTVLCITQDGHFVVIEVNFVDKHIHQSLPVWGVQYHPERLAGSLPKSRASDGRRLLAAWLSLCR